jgi:hypothetical protein
MQAIKGESKKQKVKSKKPASKIREFIFAFRRLPFSNFNLFDRLSPIGGRIEPQAVKQKTAVRREQFPGQLDDRFGFARDE